MATTLPPIQIEAGDWVSVNAESGIALGQPMVLLNDGTSWLRLKESTTKPLATDKEGIPLTNINYPYARADIEAGSLELWVREATGNRVGRLIVQGA